MVGHWLITNGLLPGYPLPQISFTSIWKASPVDPSIIPRLSHPHLFFTKPCSVTHCMIMRATNLCCQCEVSYTLQTTWMLEGLKVRNSQTMYRLYIQSVLPNTGIVHLADHNGLATPRLPFIQNFLEPH